MSLPMFDSDRCGLDLDRDGIAVWPERMPSDLLARVKDHLICSPVYNAHVWAQSDRKPKMLDQCPDVACTTQETLITAPGFLEFVDRFTPIAQAYIGQEPALMYSLNAFWTMPSEAPPIPVIQGWHRDHDDRKFLAMFVYGSDIDRLEDGPHQFGKKSQGQEGPVHPDDVESVYGPAGTIFFADTSALHRGLKPRLRRRLIFWARWGVSEPPASYGWDKLTPLDRDQVRYPYRHDLRLVMR